MELWIIYGIVAAALVSVSDLIRKHLTNTNHIQFVALFPLSIAGILSFIYLCSNGGIKELKNVKGDNIWLLIILIFCVIFVQYCIANCLKNISNPGYGKAIISLNILITTLIAIYFFKSAQITKYTIGGILLIIAGTLLLIINSK